MHGRETRMLLRHYLEQGTSKSALARQFGVQPRHDSSVDYRHPELDRRAEAARAHALTSARETG